MEWETSGQARRLRLRYPAVCSVCGAELSPGIEAWWDSATKKAKCLVCGSGPELARELAGQAGGSAAAKHERLRARRRKQLEGAFGKRLGGVADALVAEPQSTRAWAKGAGGEAHLGRVLEQKLRPPAVVLHDRQIPMSVANIDHIVISASGVWVIDAKNYTGKVRRRSLGPIWKRTPAVFVGGRNRKGDVDGMTRQVRAVRDVLSADPEGSEVPVFAVICLMADWDLLASPFVIDGVLVTWPKNLAKRISARGSLSDEVVTRLANRIAVRLPSGSGP